MRVADKDKIEMLIVPFLSRGKRGNCENVDFTAVMESILHKLKTGTQWRMLPLELFFSDSRVLTWAGVYYHFNRWAKDGSFARMWVGLLQLLRRQLNLSSIQLDGSLTLAQRGGEQVGYQRRKRGNCTNALFFVLTMACRWP